MHQDAVSHPLLIVSALEVETRRLREALGAQPLEDSSGLLDGLWWGVLPAGTGSGGARARAAAGDASAERLLVAATGAGATRAAAGLAALLAAPPAALPPALILGVGIAGGVDAGCRLGDVVVADRVVQYDHDASELGFPPGVLERGDTTWRELETAERRGRLVARLEAAVGTGERRVREGPVASGSTLLSAARLEALPAHWRALLESALACDMESAAWASLAARTRLPFLAVRLISDTLGEPRRLGVGAAAAQLGELLAGALMTCRITSDGAIVSR